MATARKLHIATELVNYEDPEAGIGAAEVVLCKTKPRQGATLWATTAPDLADCAKCVAAQAELDRLAAEAHKVAELVEITHEHAAELIEQIDALGLVGKNLPAADGKAMRKIGRAYRSGVAYATNGQFYANDETKALKSFLRKVVVEPRTIEQVAAFVEGFRSTK